TSKARASSILPMKIVNYSIALECLFNTRTSEISHKIAESVALLLGISSSSKNEMYHLIKSAYSYRSKLVHGKVISGVEDDLVDISNKLDIVLRDLIVANHEVFSKNDNDI